MSYAGKTIVVRALIDDEVIEKKLIVNSMGMAIWMNASLGAFAIVAA